MSFSPGSGAVIRFTVAGAQAAQRQIETVGDSFNQLGTLARNGLAALAAGYAALNLGAYVKDATLLAARYETLGIVMHTAGVNAGYSNVQMDAYAQGLEKSGISMVKAREAMTAMTTANLDNNKSLELGRMAQNLAVVANRSSSDTLTDLITNIQQADTEGLKYMGIILNQDEALQKYAVSHNTVTKALTQTQKAEAIQAAVMQQGAKYAGIYEKAMGTAGKALGSLDRYFENIKVRLGTPFLEGFAQGVFGVTDGVKQLNTWLDQLEKNGAMEKLAKSIGSVAGTVISVIKDTIEITGQFASGIVKVGQVAAKFFDDYLGGMTTIKYVTIAFALLLSGYMVEQAIIGFNAVSASAWGAVGKVGAAFAAMSTTVVTFFTMLAGAASAFGWGSALLMGAKTIVAAVGAAISSIPGAVGAVVVAAGLALGYGLVAVFGDTISKGLDSVMERYLPTVKTKIDSFIAWVVAKTHDLPEISEAVVRSPDETAKAAANKAEKDRKEQLMREMNNSVVAAETQIAITSAANIRLKALDDLRDQQLKQSLDQRIITQADYLQKKEKMDVAEAQGQLAQIAAQKAQLAAYMAAFKAGAPLGQGRDPAADANEMIKLSGEEAAAQTKLNAVKQSYAYQIADAVIESYTKEFGSISSIVDAQEQLVRVTRQSFLEAGKTAEQRETVGALRMQSAADELSAELEAKRANGTATKEYIQNTAAMITALNQMGQARLKAVGSNVAITFINDTKAMRDDTTALYADMKNTFIGTEEERVRAASAASIRLADIRKKDAYAAIDGTNDTDTQKIAAKQKVLKAYNDYVNSVNQNADAKALQSSRGFESLRDAIGSAFDVTRVESFGQAMSDAFGNAGTALGGLIDAFTLYDQRQKESEDARKVANVQYKDDAGKLAAAQAAITMKQQRDQLGYYATVAGAAKGFFKENSTGYKAMEAAEKAYRAFELAIAIKNQLEKLGLLTTFTAAHETATLTQVATTQASVAPDVAASMAKGQAAAAAGVAAQASGDPYTAWARMAAMAAAMAALGFAVSGAGGGVSVSQARQAAQGTGTVLGDSSAKSDSIARAIKLAAENSSTQINYLSGMLSSLQSIQANITNFAAALMRTADVANPSVNLNSNNGLATTAVKLALVGPLGALATSLLPSFVNNWVGKLSTAVFGGKQSLNDSGFTLGKESLGSALATGVNGQTYAEIHTSGGLLRKSHNDTQTNNLSADANAQLTAIVKSMADAVKQAGSLLGVSGDAFTQKLNSFVIDIGKVSLKGLSAEDQQKALEAVFSKLGDQMAQFAVSGLQQFQKAGEGYLETLVRVASDYARVDASLQSIGKTFGEVGVQSVAAREALVDLMGGIDEFQSKTAGFGQNFLTKAQQLAPVATYVTQQLQSMNLGWVQTRAQFAGVVSGLDLTTEAGRNTYASLMNLQEAFAATHAEIVDTTKTAQDIADERKDLQSQLDGLTLSSVELLAKQRDALDDSNKGLFDQVQAAQKVKNAQDAAKSSLGDFIGQMKSFATTVKGLNNSLALGALSTLTPEQQYAEARRQFDRTRQQAAAGDATAQGNLQSIEQTFLQLSQKINGGDANYSSDLATVMRTNDELAQWATQSVDVAQASLNALNDSSATLTDISATLKAIAQGVQYLPEAISGENATGYVQAATPVDYSRMGTLDMAPLVAEVKALREEVKGLRAEALKRTGDLIQANESTAQRAADKVVEGIHDAVTDGAYAQTNSTRTIK